MVNSPFLAVRAAVDGLGSLSTRASGALPAISAPLMAPIEMPAIQLGRRSASVNAS
jgi:hypothetical protein